MDGHCKRFRPEYPWLATLSGCHTRVGPDEAQGRFTRQVHRWLQVTSLGLVLRDRGRRVGRAARVGSSVALIGRASPDDRPDGASHEADLRPTRVDRLIYSGLFDAAFYTAAAGRDFESERHAARHCINVGMPQGHSPNPLLDIYSVPRSVRTAWRRGQIGKVLEHLESEAGWAASSGPLFYPPALQHPLIGPHRPGSAIAQFLAHADNGTLLPVPPGYWGPAPTLAEARDGLIAHAGSAARCLHTDDMRQTPGHEAAVASLRDELEAHHPGTFASPRVTLICAAPASPRHFIETLDRLRDQTLTDWELLVPSGDWDPELNRVVEVASARDARIKVVESCPGSHSNSRCASLWNALGEYVAFVTPEARWDHDFLRQDDHGPGST